MRGSLEQIRVLRIADNLESTLLVHLFTLLCVSGLEEGSCPAYLSSQTHMLRPTFTLFGDSLTQRSFDEGGWGARLASEYQRKVGEPHNFSL